MARRRSNRTTAPPAPTPTTNTQATPTTQGEKTKMANSLSLDDIAGLLSGARSKGDYDRVLDEFLGSDAVGVVVASSDADDKPVTEGDFTGKTVSQISTGLNNARTRMNKDTQEPLHPGGHKVKVIKRKQKDGENDLWVVALVNLAKYSTSDDDEDE